ncbi:MAG: ScpA family protein [bacterium]|nr:ScpA family protein [bacterium]
MAHAVQLEQFAGPLDLLLQLIEQEELDITTVALATVCEAYLAHLRQMESRAPEDVADFLVIAAKLLYLKSLALLPEAQAEAVADDTGLAEQLRIYRAFVEAAKGIAERFGEAPQMYPSARIPVEHPAFLPPPNVSLDALAAAMVRVIQELEPIVRIPKATIGRAISIDDRIAEIRTLIAARPRTLFTDILRGRVRKDERIVSFLAVLELVKQRVVDFHQEGRFTPITVVRCGAGE